MNLLGWIRERYHPLWRLRQLSWFRFLQKKIDFPVRRRFRKGVFYGMFIRDFPVLAQPFASESVTCAVLDKLVQTQKTTHFFDLGANIGLLSWHVLSVAANTEVFLFEPDPANIALLRKSIQANHRSRIHLWAGVVAEAVGSREFLIDEASGATGSLPEAELFGGPLQAAYQVQKRLRVEAITLDAYAERVPATGAKVILKIDVEGAEAEVFAGGRRFIHQHRPIIIIECFQPESLQPLIQTGYRIRALDQNRNYLLWPAEMSAEIEEVLGADPLPTSPDPARR